MNHKVHKVNSPQRAQRILRVLCVKTLWPPWLKKADTISEFKRVRRNKRFMVAMQIGSKKTNN